MTHKRTPKQAFIGPMSRNSANVPHYIAPRVDLSDVPHRVTNAGSKQPLVLAAEWASAKRPGAMDFLSFSSRGIRC